MNKIAEQYSKNTASYTFQPLPRNLWTTDATFELTKFRRKVNEAFKILDRDGSGTIDKEEFGSLLSLMGVKLDERELSKIINHVDIDNSGAVELAELEKFLKEKFHARQIVRCDMSSNLTHPNHFLKYHVWHVTDRPLNFSLRPGANMLAAYFECSSSAKMFKRIKRGYRLTYINNSRVDRTNYSNIKRTLETISLPFTLVFQNRYSIRREKLHDRSGNFYTLNCNDTQDWEILPEERKLFGRPAFALTNFGKTNDKSQKQIHQYHDHCKHCPSEESCWISLHLFMEDENFSSTSHFMAYLIMFLIFLSTFTYIFQTLPSWEDWWGWEMIEEIVSILFGVEFLLRLLCCRKIKSYMRDAMNVIDFCACIPYWIELSTGGSETHFLRLIRVVRLLRLIRLAKSRSLHDILEIFKMTFKDSLHWLVMFLSLYSVITICIASLAWIAEVGEETVIGNCDMLTAENSCQNTSSLAEDTIRNVTSTVMCSDWCEEFARSGCCSFRQIDGRCWFYRDTAIVNSTNSYIISGNCHVRETLLRRDGTTTPFYTVVHSLWWACVTMTTIGYGEVYTITEAGRVISLVATWMGIMFLSAPIGVFGFHFALSRISNQYHKVPIIVNEQLDAVERESVNQFLEKVNEGIGMKVFERMDSVAFLANDTHLNTKNKIEQVLKYYSGWSYMPFASHELADLPRLTQFKLFALFCVFGRKFQKIRMEHKKQDERFHAGLKKISKNRDKRSCDRKFSWRESSSTFVEEDPQKGGTGISFVYGEAGAQQRVITPTVRLKKSNTFRL